MNPRTVLLRELEAGMPDQAEILRHLARSSQREFSRPTGPAPMVLAVAGGQGEVGTTTMAVNIATALAQLGNRVLLADADPCRGDVAALCSAEQRDSLQDVLASRRSIHEVLQPGPLGVGIIAGNGSSQGYVDRLAHHRLLDQFSQSGNYVDAVVIDIGSAVAPASEVYWQRSDQLLLVTTANPMAVVDAYAAIKAFAQRNLPTDITLVVNQSPSVAVAQDVHTRLHRSCAQFLGIAISWLGAVPFDSYIPLSARMGKPVNLRSPTCVAARAIDRIAAAAASRHQQRASIAAGR